jgi:hypothetical protein
LVPLLLLLLLVLLVVMGIPPLTSFIGKVLLTGELDMSDVTPEALESPPECGGSRSWGSLKCQAKICAKTMAARVSVLPA